MITLIIAVDGNNRQYVKPIKFVDDTLTVINIGETYQASLRALLNYLDTLSDNDAHFIDVTGQHHHGLPVSVKVSELKPILREMDIERKREWQKAKEAGGDLDVYAMQRKEAAV